MLTKYKAVFSLGIISSMEYRLDYFVSLFGAMFPIMIQVFLWIAIYGGSQDKELYGYKFPQMIAYIVIAAFVNRMVNTEVENVINDDIHSGGIAKYLIKPIGYITFRMLYLLGQKLSSVITILLFSFGAIAFLHRTVGLEIYYAHILLFIPALLLGLILNFFIFFIISMLAFWLTEVGSFFMTVQVIITVISGGVFPITIMGDTFVTIMKYLPFIYTTYFPAQLLTGAILTPDIRAGMGLQMFWICLLSFISVLLWRAGSKRYVAVGG